MQEEAPYYGCDWAVADFGTRRLCAHSGSEKLGDRHLCPAHVRKMEDTILEMAQADPRFRDRLIQQVREADLEEMDLWTEHRRGITRWPADPPPRAHAVYFIEREGLCKIGRTADVAGRARSISRGSCMPDGMTVGPVRTLAVIYCNCPALCVRERWFHKRFRHLHHQLEWFRLDAELRNFIGGLEGCDDDEMRAASWSPRAS